MLITGATGFIGTQLVRELENASIEVVPVIRAGNRGCLEKMPHIKRFIESSDIFQEGADWWQEQCADVDTVIHAAWYVEPGKYLHSPRNMDCLRGSLNLAHGAVSAGIRRFIGVGTCFEYATRYGVLSVDTPLDPLTPYAAAKAASFMALAQWLPEQSVEFAWCRLFYLYGEGEHEDRLVPYIRKCLSRGQPARLTGGTQIRDFLDVAEAGRLLAKVALGAQQGAINICSGLPVTVRQLAEQIATEFGRQDLLQFGSRADNPFDPPCVVGVPNHGLSNIG